MPTEKDCLWITERRGIYLDPWTPNDKETQYSLTPVQKGRDGKVYMQMVRYQVYDRDAKAWMQDEKDKPAKVLLGTKEEAIKALHSLLDQLGVLGVSQATPLPEPKIDDDIPF